MRNDEHDAAFARRYRVLEQRFAFIIPHSVFILFTYPLGHWSCARLSTAKLLFKEIEEKQWIKKP